MAIWQILDVSKLSAQYGLQFKRLDYNPESILGFVTLNNSNDDLLRIKVDLGKRLLSLADIDQRKEAGELDLNQANYLKEEAGIELAKLVYPFD